jgi:hypothetical protein
MKILSFFILVFLFSLSVKSEKFKNIQKALKQLLTQIPEQLTDLGNELKKDPEIENLLTIMFIAFNPKIEITEYIGVKESDTEKLVSNLTYQLFLKNENSKSLLREIKDTFISGSSEMYYDDLSIEASEQIGNYYVIFGEHSKDKSSIDLLIYYMRIRLLTGGDETNVNTSSHYLFGLISKETERVQTTIKTLENRETELIYKYLQLMSLQSTLDYFNIFNPFQKHFALRPAEPTDD